MLVTFRKCGHLESMWYNSKFCDYSDIRHLWFWPLKILSNKKHPHRWRFMANRPTPTSTSWTSKHCITKCCLYWDCLNAIIHLTWQLHVRNLLHALSSLLTLYCGVVPVDFPIFQVHLFVSIQSGTLLVPTKYSCSTWQLFEEIKRYICVCIVYANNLSWLNI